MIQHKIIDIFLKAVYKLDLTGFQATQSSTWQNSVASRAIDGQAIANFNDNSCTATDADPDSKKNPWWFVDMEEPRVITRVDILNRGE